MQDGIPETCIPSGGFGVGGHFLQVNSEGGGFTVGTFPIAAPGGSGCRPHFRVDSSQFFPDGGTLRNSATQGSVTLSRIDFDRLTGAFTATFEPDGGTLSGTFDTACGGY